MIRVASHQNGGRLHRHVEWDNYGGLRIEAMLDGPLYTQESRAEVPIECQMRHLSQFLDELNSAYFNVVDDFIY